METSGINPITIKAEVQAPIEKVWKFWNEPEHIKNWAFALDTWHSPHAENDLQKGGKFSTTMAAKDGSVSFDFAGVYTTVEQHQLIEYTLNDGRKVSVSFSEENGTVKISESFQPEDVNPIEMQEAGWQAILNNFKNYVEEK
ncbi:polyketide cyclase [Pedobacter sp. HMF7647]|uniref:Polyketide cyclase n=1 Tax=Hufsiella arboris TaxID=2695275 RepID=A0A7K1YBT3_9SPHI|nr:SRPBCC family protein [Hufsiella arboris]MXV51821.1 polyketide cyclase [Hufsiella arboris]